MSTSAPLETDSRVVTPPVTVLVGGPADQLVEVVDDPHNQRVKFHDARPPRLDAATPPIARDAAERGPPRTKWTVYAPKGDDEAWRERGFRLEAVIRGYFRGGADAYLWARYVDPERAEDPLAPQQDRIVTLARSKPPHRASLPEGVRMRQAGAEDVGALSAFLRSVFADYPSSLAEEHLLRLVESGASRFHVIEDAAGRLLASASAEIDRARGNAEITDCATRPDQRGRGLMAHLIRSFERTLPQEEDVFDLYTLARANEVGMNCAFARAGYTYTGRLVNNCRMPGGYESMSVWCRRAESIQGLG